MQCLLLVHILISSENICACIRTKTNSSRYQQVYTNNNLSSDGDVVGKKNTEFVANRKVMQLEGTVGTA